MNGVINTVKKRHKALKQTLVNYVELFNVLIVIVFFSFLGLMNQFFVNFSYGCEQQSENYNVLDTFKKNSAFLNASNNIFVDYTQNTNQPPSDFETKAPNPEPKVIDVDSESTVSDSPVLEDTLQSKLPVESNTNLKPINKNDQENAQPIDEQSEHQSTDKALDTNSIKDEKTDTENDAPSINSNNIEGQTTSNAESNESNVENQQSNFDSNYEKNNINDQRSESIPGATLNQVNKIGQPLTKDSELNKNEDEISKENNADASLFPELPVEKETTSKLPANEDVIEVTTDALNQTINEKESIGSYTKRKTKEFTKKTIEAEVKNKTIAFFEQFGKIAFDFSLEHQLKISNYEVKYLLPIVNYTTTNLLTQENLKLYDGRTILNMGFILRDLREHFMVGSNVFFDYDFSLGHSRYSIGVEAATNYFRSAVNYYNSLGGSKYLLYAINNFNYSAQPASGFDLHITGYLPFERSIFGTLYYSKWLGGYVDTKGLFKLSEYLSIDEQTTKNPSLLNLSVGWQPMSLVSSSLGYLFQNKKKPQLNFSINFNWNFDLSTEKQTSYQGSIDNSFLKGMKESFVQRQNDIILNYEKSNSDQKVSILSVLVLPINTSHEIKPIIHSATPPVSYQWTGSAVSLLNKIDIANPMIVIPNSSAVKDFGFIQLKVINADGEKLTSNKTQVYLKTPYRLKLFTDEKLDRSLTKYFLFNGKQNYKKIFWQLISPYSNQPFTPAKWQWKDIGSILKSGDQKHPEFKTVLSDGSYTVDLYLEDLCLFNSETFSIPVQVTAQLPKVTHDVKDIQAGIAHDVTIAVQHSDTKNLHVEIEFQQGSDISTKTLTFQAGSNFAGKTPKLKPKNSYKSTPIVSNIRFDQQAKKADTFEAYYVDMALMSAGIGIKSTAAKTSALANKHFFIKKHQSYPNLKRTRDLSHNYTNTPWKTNYSGTLVSPYLYKKALYNTQLGESAVTVSVGSPYVAGSSLQTQLTIAGSSAKTIAMSPVSPKNYKADFTSFLSEVVQYKNNACTIKNNNDFSFEIIIDHSTRNFKYLAKAKDDVGAQVMQIWMTSDFDDNSPGFTNYAFGDVKTLGEIYFRCY